MAERLTVLRQWQMTAYARGGVVHFVIAVGLGVRVHAVIRASRLFLSNRDGEQDKNIFVGAVQAILESWVEFVDHHTSLVTLRTGQGGP